MKSNQYRFNTLLFIFLVYISSGFVKADSVIVFNEIMYHPETTQLAGEWIELHNQMAVDVDISGWAIKGGVKYTFPEGTFLKGGDYLVIAENPILLEQEYDLTGVLGPYDGNLSNGGESFRLENNANRVMDSLEYNDKGGWPIAADGAGVTLAKKNKNLASAFAGNWTWSEQIGGTPGNENFPSIDTRPNQVELVNKNDVWRYLPLALNLGQTWLLPEYNDIQWIQGNSGFYYGDQFVGNQQVPIDTLYSSGVDDDGNPLVAGAADPHYYFASDGTPVIAMQNHSAWLANDQFSQWIGFSGQGTDNQPFGQFNIITSFDLDGYDSSTAEIKLYIAVDNRLDDVLINGNSTGISCSDYSTWYGPYTIDSGFIVGLNELEFVYVNEGSSANPAGLRIKLEGTAIETAGQTELATCPVTSYFRKTFTYDKPETPTQYELSLSTIIDDGAVFYLNGTEVYRVNMPEGDISFSDYALSNVTGDPITIDTVIDETLLNDGENILAVEVHQAQYGLDDLFFIGELAVIETPIRSGEGFQFAFHEVTSGADQEGWLELVNYGTHAIDLDTVLIASSGLVNADYEFQSEILEAGEYRLISESELGFHPTEDDQLFLYAPGGTGVLDAVIVKDHHQAREVPGLTKWYTTQQMTPGLPNSISINSDIVINEIMYHKGDITGNPGVYDTETLISPESMVSVIVPTDSSLGLKWTGGDEPYNDSAWYHGQLGIGYDTGTDYNDRINFDIQSIIYNINQSYYARIPFDFEMANINSMMLEVDYDDGFIIYLNGQKIAERYAPSFPSWNSGADDSHEALSSETIDVSEYASYLKEGDNVLAIHGLNYGIRSSDLLFTATLSVVKEVIVASEPDESDEEWIELYNCGNNAVDLSGWEIEGGIDYTFEEGTVLGVDEYLIVTRDRDGLLADYPSLTIVGDYDGRLSNTSERIILNDANGNIADEVQYYDGKPWPEQADGYNASLELRHPQIDNSNALAWRASDERTKSQWKTYSYRGIAQPSSTPSPDSQWREFVIGMLDAGEILLDDFHVIEDPDGSATELLQNGSFETSPGESTWRLLGTHRHSQVVIDPDNPSNHVLQLIATGQTDHMHNHLETTFANGLRITNGREYEISFKAKWISGSNQLNTRLYFNRLANTTLIEKTHFNGTPGYQNTCYESNTGPLFTNLQHYPAVPGTYEPVQVTIDVNDPDGISQAILYWRLDGQSWNSVAMSQLEGSAYSAAIPPQASGLTVQFYVQAEDSQSMIATYPASGENSRAFYRVDDGLAATNGLHNVRIIMTEEDDNWLHSEVNVMSNDRIGATVIYDEKEIFYEVGIRLKGSQHHRTPSNEVGFNIAFNADHLFRGVHKTVAIDRSQGVGFGQREMLINQAMNRMGHTVSKYTDLIKVIPPKIEHTSAAEMQLARFNDEYLTGQFEDGQNGYLYEFEYIYYPYTTIGGEEDYKRPLPDYVVGASITNLGASKEDYRWIYLAKNNRAWDSYDDIIHFAELFGDTSQAYYDNLEDLIDVDQWLSSFAIAAACGAGDNYGGDNSQHNAMFYVRPSDKRVLYFPHDLDHDYNAYRPIIPNTDLNKMIVKPGYERLYYGYLYYFLSNAYNATYMGYWSDHFADLLVGQDYPSYLSFIDQRSQYLLSEISNRISPAYGFEITDPNSIVDTDYVAVHGKAWIDIHEVYLDGFDDPLNLEWTSAGTGTAKQFYWTAVVPVEPGVNELVFSAYGFDGQLVSENHITITSTLEERPLRDYLKITEIMYNPAGGTDYEFIELANTGAAVLDVSEIQFVEGIEFDFATGSISALNPGEHLVVVKDLPSFTSQYDTAGMLIAGEYSGKLSNDGETLTLVDRWNSPILSLTYGDGRYWPVAADGAGHSLVPEETVQHYSPDYPKAWRASTYMDGSPGLADPLPSQTVLLNEICAHTDYSNSAKPEYDSNDWIELYNSTASSLTLSSGQWFLSDDKDNLKKWEIPEITIPSGDWVVFDEVSGFHQPITSGFGLNKAGEEVYLSYLPGNSNDRVVDAVQFKGQKSGLSLGRLSDGAEYWQVTQPTAYGANRLASDHIIISEVMYHPEDGHSEYIELYNPTSTAVNLWNSETQSGWRLNGGVSYSFASNVTIPAYGYLLVVPFEPDQVSIDAFVADYGPVCSEIVGPYSGELSNSGEFITLEEPELADVIGESDSWVIIDELYYSDQTPWSNRADGVGAALWRKGSVYSGINPIGWDAVYPTPGTHSADFNTDGIVNMLDFVRLTERWLETGESGAIVIGDLYHYDDEIIVNIDDLMILVDYWLCQVGQ